MKKGLSELVFILDKSGSMAGLEKDTIGGFNAMLEKQRGVAGECRITTALFSDCLMLLHDRLDIRAVGGMTEKEYRVGGSTALLDAIGSMIDNIVNVQKSTAEPYRAAKVLFVIITDGEENSSHLYSSDRVKKMIELEKTQYGWEFVFLGANIDAVQTARGIGIDANHAVDYVPDSTGTALNFEMMSKAVAEFRVSPSDTIANMPLERIREDAKKRGKKSSWGRF